MLETRVMKRRLRSLGRVQLCKTSGAANNVFHWTLMKMAFQVDHAGQRSQR